MTAATTSIQNLPDFGALGSDLTHPVSMKNQQGTTTLVPI